MSKIVKKLPIIVGVIMMLASCASPKKIVYFQDVAGVTVNDTVFNFEPTIQVGDILAINVSAIDGEAALPFNIYETPITGSNSTSAKPITYLVNAEGDIHFPVLGKLRVLGLTTKQTNEKLTGILETYIKNPIINIRLENFKVTVLGEVTKPGSFVIPDERVSVLDAIALAGDLTIYGKRETVTVIREQNGQRQFVTLDLTNKDLFNSPYFYLSQNDVVYIEPNNTRVNASAVGPSVGVLLSVTSIIISLVILFTN